MTQTAQLNKLLKEIETKAIADSVPIICSDTRYFLLSSILPNARILEVGTAIGYSGILMLSSAKGSTLTTIDMRQERLQQAANYFKKAGFSERVKLINADALEFLTECNDKFDFIFLDGAIKKYSDMLMHLKRVLEKSGKIVIDNALLLNRSNAKHTRKFTQKMDEFIRLLQSDSSFKTAMHKIGDGIFVAHYTNKI